MIIACTCVGVKRLAVMEVWVADIVGAGGVSGTDEHCNATISDVGPWGLEVEPTPFTAATLKWMISPAALHE